MLVTGVMGRDVRHINTSPMARFIIKMFCTVWRCLFRRVRYLKTGKFLYLQLPCFSLFRLLKGASLRELHTQLSHSQTKELTIWLCSRWDRVRRYVDTVCRRLSLRLARLWGLGAHPRSEYKRLRLFPSVNGILHLIRKGGSQKIFWTRKNFDPER